MALLLFRWLAVSLFWFNVPADQTNATVAVKHPFYIAVTEINHNAKDKTLEISCKMFAEDLEQILEKDYKAVLDITKDADKSRFDQYIPDYVGKRLSLSVDGKPVKLSYVGFEQEKESAYCYFQVDNVPSLKKIDVSNSLLYDYNEAQINITHVTVNGNRQSNKLVYPDKVSSFSF
jgi:hypothetical protein